MRPQSYRSQDSCVNCMACFILKEYDSPDTYYCTWRASKRPRCGSVYMDEGFCSAGKKYDRGQFRDLMDIWDKWSVGRQVMPMGICNMWRKADEA